MCFEHRPNRFTQGKVGKAHNASGNSSPAGFAQRIRECWALAESLLSSSRYYSYASPEGGFYVTLRLDQANEERVAEAILRQNHCLVHPGYFYDIEADHLVLSFIQKPEVAGNLIPALLKTVESIGKFGKS